MSQLDVSKAEFKAAYGTSAQLPKAERPEIVFSGRSNVGKSSLINALCGRKKLARTSATPGKTATINFYEAGGVYLVDLPGYGYAKTSKGERRRWDELINGYFSGQRQLYLLVQLLDCRHEPSKDDRGMLDYLSYYKIPFIAALTKADKIKPSQHERILEDFSLILKPYHCREILLTSAEKKLGIETLKNHMETVCLQTGAE
ncbi:ribosome biogenesis GTP-binding protein YihA/YsxC [Ruminococcaceae bacterium OttesenSCG-928-I18]|nr:ribosome biogenesis GTP-binding protein YihA/YsxC [Ruminococcaceae bacterium OttesenSCG-928-I18]